MVIGALGGVLCDSRLRASADDLYAAGDSCEYQSPMHGQTARIEHERVAQAQGGAVARNMLGADEPYREVPYFWSDLADWATLEYVGLGRAWDEEIVRGDPDSGVFSVLQLSAGRLVGVVTAGQHSDLDEAGRLVASRETVDHDQLTTVAPAA